MAAAPRPGDVALFRHGGHDGHVGIVTTPGMMLHVREGKDAAVESYTGSQWKHRLEGVYRYEGERAVTLLTPDSGVRVVGCPSPFSFERVDAVMPAGMTLAEVIAGQCDAMNVPAVARKNGHAYIDAAYYPQSEWDHVCPRDGQVVTFRIYPGGSGGWRMAFMVVVAIVATFAAIATKGALAGGAYAAWANVAGAAVYAGISVVGFVAANALFPAPTVKQPNFASVGSPHAFLSGSQNQLRQYGAVPQVLGIGRMTADYLGKPYSERSSEHTNHLRAAYCWGYGPLEITDIRNGDTPISRYQEMELVTFQGYKTDPGAQLYTRDIDETALNIAMQSDKNKYVSDWYYFTTPDDTDQINLEFYYPQGQWCQSKNNGSYKDADVNLQIQIRQRPSGEFQNIAVPVYSASFTLQSCLPYIYTEQVYDDAGNLEAEDWWLTRYGVPKKRTAREISIDLWQWYTYSLDKNNRIIQRVGCVCDSKYNEPSEHLLRLMAQGKCQWNSVAFPPRLPPIGENEELLYYVCVYGNSILEINDRRDSTSVSGVDASYSGLTLSLSYGEVLRGVEERFNTSAKKKLDPFTRSYTFNLPRGQFEIRCRRTGKNYSDYDNIRYNQLVWRAVRCRKNGQPFKLKIPISRTELRVRATNQLNGTLDSINAAVASIVNDYNYKTEIWEWRKSGNPASLFRHVLQGPAIAEPLSDNQIDIAALEHWHKFCRVQGFSYFNILGADSSLSVFDVLTGIAAAGRATPDFRDGKWTVVIDEPRTTIVQHFTTHNSWGFSGTKVLPDIPHAIRANFVNKEKGFAQDILTVYADGYGPGNAKKYEEWPIDRMEGITSPNQVMLAVRFAMAWAKLRPENYRLFCDIEHIVCTRGDLVRVTNDVAMWGLGSGRVKSVIKSGGIATGLVLDEAMRMQPGVDYTLRCRLGSQKGATRKFTLARVSEDDFYGTVYFAEPQTANLPAEGDLFQFGQLDKESHELLVEFIRPNAQGNAEIGLIDYSPEIYTVDDSPLPEFNSDITEPPALPRNIISSIPGLDSVWSDERALIVLPDGTLQCRIGVSFSVPSKAESAITHIQAMYREYEDGEWKTLDPVALTDECVYVSSVDEGGVYDIALRFVSSDGLIGPWNTVLKKYQLIGKTTPPPDIAWLSVENRRLLWPTDNMPLDVKNGGGYEIRIGYGQVTSWNDLSRIRDGFVTDGLFDISNYIDGLMRTFGVVARDSGGRQSKNAAFFTTTEFLDKTGPNPGNLVYTLEQSVEGWPGEKTGCRVSGGILVPQETTYAYPQKNGGIDLEAPFYPQTQNGAVDDDALIFDRVFSAMAYTFYWRVPSDLVGQDARVSIKESGKNLDALEYSLWGSGDYFYPQVLGDEKINYDAPVYPQKEDGTIDYDAQIYLEPVFYPVPAVLKTIQNATYIFRVRMRGGSKYSDLQEFALYIDMPDISIDLTNVAISASGARLPIGSGWHAVKWVNLFVLDDGGNAVYARAADMSKSGPLVYCYDISGNKVAGTVNATPVLGY